MNDEYKFCSVAGCGKPLKAKGYCGNHYKKFIELPKKRAEQTALTKVAKQQQASQRMSERAAHLTMAQLEKIFTTPCRTEKDLKNYIKYFFNLHLPDCKVSRYADTTPFHAIWEVYDICVNSNNPQNVQELLYVAGRGSGKCVSQDTVIITNKGTKYVQNVKVGDLVWTGWSWKPVVETFDEGVKDGVTITTKHLAKDGAWSLTGSIKHRVQALDPETGKIDWVHMKNLTPGQVIYRSLESLGSLVDTSSSDYGLGWLVGCITGDGSVSRFDNAISFAAKDKDQLVRYKDTIIKHFGVEPKIKYDKRSPSLSIASICNKSLRGYYDSIIEGELCYFKKLKTLNHSPSFLAGFISGMMETDGSKDSITLANPELIKQIAQILNLFGVHAVINKKRRKPSTTKFVKDHVVEYHCVDYKTALPEYLMPLFSKREAFKIYSAKMNEQFRYPSKLLKPFASFIKDKYEIANGYWRLEAGKKTHSDIKYSKDLWGSGEKSKEFYVYGYKIDYFINLARRLGEHDWADYLSFIRKGCYETVDSVTFGKHYFYDLEVDTDHAYWSNGFISHNTLGMAIAELLVLLHDQRDVVHVGAILSQAKRCYEYQQKFLMSERIKPLVLPAKTQDQERILEKSTMEKSVFNVSNEKVTLEVLPCTMRALNGPHVPLVVVDEIDTVSGEAVKAYKEISGMLDSKRGKKPLRVGISTRKSRYGLMNQAIENAEKQGRHVRRWTAFEFTERCPDSRSGTTKQEYYIDQNSFDIRLPSEYNKLSEQKKKDYAPYEMYSGCHKCPLAPICLGDAKNQTSTSPMLKSIDELAQKILSEGPDWAMSQLMNLKPSVEGIVFKEFDERIHVRTWNQMWLTLTGKEFPGECSHDIFVKKCLAMGLPAYSGIDWGWSNPHTLVTFFVDSKENIYVVRCDGMTYISRPAWMHHVKNKWHQTYRVQLYFPDQADPGDAVEMRKLGLPTSTNTDKGQVNTGIQVIKKWLKVPGTGEPKIFFAQETCQPLIREFQLYHYKVDASGQITDDPDTEHDHWIDALRYAMTNLFSKSAVILSSAGLDVDMAKLVDSTGSFFKPPTPEEYAKVNNIPFNPEVNLDKMGKIGRLSDIEDNEDQGSDGGFIWTF
jgi:intein/homing endonuclease